jgi:hypothetical protein
VSDPIDTSPQPPQRPFPRFDPAGAELAGERLAVDELNGIVRELVRRYNGHLEQMLQRSLTDPEERGVLVTKHRSDPSRWEMDLSADVPWGQIEERYSDD